MSHRRKTLESSAKLQAACEGMKTLSEIFSWSKHKGGRSAFKPEENETSSNK